MANKQSVSKLKQRISKIVKEELEALTEAEVNPHLERVKDKKKFAEWLMRQYFDPQKNADKEWYDESVSVDNVLEYISDPKNQFPLTPAQIASMWRDMKSLKSSMKQVSDKELAAMAGEEQSEDDEEEEKATYQTGERTLKDIGQELGGLTPTMINKIAGSGMEKVKKLLGASLEDMDEDQLDKFITTIYQARVDAAQDYAEALVNSNGKIKDFLQSLVKKQILSPSELKVVNSQEVQGLQQLADKSAEEIRNVLLNDIERDNNVFKSFQSMVSKKVFPPKKRGRPPKKK